MRILLVSHGYPPSASAGTEVYTRELARAFARQDGCEVWVLTRDADRCRPEYTVVRETDGPIRVVRINNTFQACESFEDSYAHPALLAVAMREIAAIAPHIVHAQHLTCLSTGLPGAVHGLGIPFVLTLNDYWLICHRGQLFDSSHQRCDGPFDDGCASCVPTGALARPEVFRAGRRARVSSIPFAGLVAHAGLKALERSIPVARAREASWARLEHMRAAVETVDLFLAPSATLASRFERFGIAPNRLQRCEQGIDLTRFASISRASSSVLRLGFAGGLASSKGGRVLLEAVARLPAGRVTVDVLGQVSGADADSVSHLLARPFVRRTGPVPHDYMAEAMAAFDVLVVPSLWIENAPFIIREAFAAGLPVVASNLGGMAEMVRDGVDGLLVEPGNVSDLERTIARLLDEPQLLTRLQRGIERPLSIDEDARRLGAIYASLRRGERPLSRTTSRSRSASPTRVAAIVLNYRTPEQTWLAARSLQTGDIAPDRLVVVDNASGDGSAAWLRTQLPAADLLEMPENLGFAGGCNAGIRFALEQDADSVLLVNSDAVLRPDALSVLLHAAQQHPVAGVVAPVLLSRAEPDRVASAGIRVDRRSGRMRHRAAGYPLSLLHPPTAHEVEAVSGGVMLIRGEVLRRAGLFDEQFFFYFEDVEFCFRARAAGFTCLCVPEAIAYHEGGVSIGRRSPRRVYFATRNHLRVAAELGSGGAAAKRLRTAAVLALNAAYVITSREVPVVSGLAAVGRGARDYFRATYGPDR
jgi:GT2 family glycosyltransferase/glycosyltransferase involved in cell wall biosynthesis